MTFKISVAARNAAVAAITALIDGGGGAGKILFFWGTEPTNLTDADQTGTGNPLATITFSATSFGSPTNGTASANGVPLSDTNANGTDTVSHFRIKDFANTVIAQGSCGQGSGDISFDNTSIVATGTVTLNSLSITQPQ